MSNSLNALKEQIRLALEQCEPENTPYVCRIISTPAGFDNVLNKVVELVIAGESVMDAIVGIDDMYDPNHID
jgi:hypothetical protein